MSNIVAIPLNHRIAAEAGIEISRAEMLAGVRSPLTLIRYADQGNEVALGLRLDIDKKVFLDHLEDELQESFLLRIAPDIAEILSWELRKLRQRDYFVNSASKPLEVIVETGSDATHGPILRPRRRQYNVNERYNRAARKTVDIEI